MRGVGGLLLAALAGLLLAGCWSRIELDHRAPVQVIALDQGEAPGEVRVSIMMTRDLFARAPGAGAGGPPADPEQVPWVISDTGRTPGEALRRLQEHSERELFSGHSRLIIIGEELAKAGIRPVMEFLDRHPEVRLRSWVMVTEGREARAMLASVSRLELIPSSAFNRQIVARRFTGTAGAITLHEFLLKLAGTTAPVAALVAPVPRPSPEEPVSEGRPGFKVSGTGVFRADRLVGYLDPPASRGLLWAIGQLQSTIIAVPCPGQPDQAFSVIIYRAGARTRVQGAPDEPAIGLAVTARGDLVDYACAADPLQPTAWAALEAALAGTIKGEVRTVLAKAQEWHADVFGFGDAVHRAFPAAWPDLKPRWDEVFATLPVDVQIEAHVLRTGTVTRPIGVTGR